MKLAEKNLKAIQANRLIRQRRNMNATTALKLEQTKTFVEKLETAMNAMADAVEAIPASISPQAQLVTLLAMSDAGERWAALLTGVKGGMEAALEKLSNTPNKPEAVN